MPPERDYQEDSTTEANLPRAIAVGFGFTSGRGKGSAFTSYIKGVNDFAVMIFVAVAIGKGKKAADAYHEAAERFGVNERTVERVYKGHEFGAYFTEQIRGGIAKYGLPEHH